MPFRKNNRQATRKIPLAYMEEAPRRKPKGKGRKEHKRVRGKNISSGYFQILEVSTERNSANKREEIIEVVRGIIEKKEGE